MNDNFSMTTGTNPEPVIQQPPLLKSCGEVVCLTLPRSIELGKRPAAEIFNHEKPKKFNRGRLTPDGGEADSRF